MAVVVSHTTALWLWCSGRVRAIASRGSSLGAWPEPMTIPAAGELEAAADMLRQITGWDTRSHVPIDILVPSGSNRRASSLARKHQWGGPVPVESFVRLSEGLYLSSPEFAFLQMAASLGTIELAQLGMSLCGAYFPCVNSRGFVDRPASTSVASLEGFILSQERTPGIGKARQSLGWVIDGARSPMEASTALLLTMGRPHGGYGLPKPQLNSRFELSEYASRMVGAPCCMIDLFYPDDAVAVEYLGRAYHKRSDRDLAREYALKADGCQVCNLTINQLTDGTQRNQVIREISDGIGFRLRPASSHMREKRNELMNAIIPRRSAITSDGSATWEKPSWALPAELAEGRFPLEPSSRKRGPGFELGDWHD